MRVVIKSIGGSGVQYLTQRYGVTENPHNPYFITEKGDLLIYLVNHPLRSLSSLNNRGFLCPAVLNCCGDINQLLSIVGGASNHGFNSLFIDEYVKGGDMIQMVNHFHICMAQPCVKVVIKFDHIPEGISFIEREFGLTPVSGIELRSQTTSPEDWEVKTLNKAMETHQDAIRLYNRLPNVSTHE